MPKTTISAAGGAMSAEGLQSASLEELALALVIALRLAGHGPYVDEHGHFGITLHVNKPTRPAPKPNLGSRLGWMLGFDDQPLSALFAHPDLVAKLIAATRELEASK
jgi:hypothetical protein